MVGKSAMVAIGPGQGRESHGLLKGMSKLFSKSVYFIKDQNVNQLHSSSDAPMKKPGFLRKSL
jgi:hypothetical protein